MCYLKYGSGQLNIETPWLSTYNGIQQPPPEYRSDDGNPKYSCNFSLSGYRGETPEVEAFYKFLQKFEDKVLNACKENGWLGKKNMTREVVEALFSPIIKPAIDKETGEVSEKYPPQIKIKVPYYEGQFQCEVYQQTSNGEHKKIEGSLDEVVCGRLNARAIIQCTMIWFAGGKFGSSWKLKQMEYKPLEQGLKPYAFRNNSPPATETVDLKQEEGDNHDEHIDSVDPEDDEEDVIVDSDED